MNRLSKILILISITLISVSGTLSAAYNSVISTDLLNIANLNRFNVRYEKYLSRSNSFTVDLTYDNNYETAMGIFVGGSYRWYLRTLIPNIKTAGLEGLSVEPWALLGLYRHETAADVYENSLSLEIGAGVAYKWVFFDALSVEPSLRLGFGAIGPSFYNDGLVLWPGISIGYAW